MLWEWDTPVAQDKNEYINSETMLLETNNGLKLGYIIEICKLEGAFFDMQQPCACVGENTTASVIQTLSGPSFYTMELSV